MIKRWWILAIVFTLALSLTSCARRRAAQPDFGFSQCDPTDVNIQMGQFDVYTIPSSTPGFYDVSVIPVTLVAPGDVVTIVAYNSGGAYKPLVQEVAAYPDQEILAGSLTENELSLYDQLAITSAVPGVSFLQASPARGNYGCRLPLPGEGAQAPLN